MKDLVGEIDKIVAEARKPKLWHQQEIGRAGLMKLVKMGVLKKDDVFPMPKFVADSPFPDKLWDKAVDQVWGKQEMWSTGSTKIRGIEHEPNYALVVRLWKMEVADEFGFEPTRTKERSLTKQVDDAVRKAAKLLGSKAAKQRKKLDKEEWNAEYMSNELDEEEWPHFDDSVFSS